MFKLHLYHRVSRTRTWTPEVTALIAVLNSRSFCNLMEKSCPFCVSLSCIVLLQKPFSLYKLPKGLFMPVTASIYGVHQRMPGIDCSDFWSRPFIFLSCSPSTDFIDSTDLIMQWEHNFETFSLMHIPPKKIAKFGSKKKEFSFRI